MLDYALWHGQQSWIEALGAVPFAPARGLLYDGRFIGAGTTLASGYGFGDFESRHELVRRSVAALRQRHLAPYAAKNTKDLLRLAQVHGVDHRTPVGATPLMLAARAGNAALARALPEWLWSGRRRKRGYVNQVLSRAEAASAYRPSRQLWVRSRHGHYLPNPTMQLRDGDSWRPVFEVMNLAWIDRGCGREAGYWRRPAAVVEQLASGAGNERIEALQP